LTSIRTAAAKHASFVALLSVFVGCESAAPSRVPDALMIVGACDSEVGGCAIAIGSEQTFSAQVGYVDGTRQLDTAAWGSDDPAVASVDGSGRVRGISAGSTAIRAQVGSLTASKIVRVAKRVGGASQGEFVVRRCTASGSFDPVAWCRDFWVVGFRGTFELRLKEESGRLRGVVVIDRSGGAGLTIDEGATLDADGRLHLTARGTNGMLGPFVELIDPLNAQVRGTSVEGSFVLTLTDERGSAFPGSVVVEADLAGVTLQ